MSSSGEYVFFPITFAPDFSICGVNLLLSRFFSGCVVTLSFFCLLFLHKRVPNMHFGWFLGI